MPVLYSLLIHPERKRAALYQGLVVLLPVADLLFGLAHLTLSLIDSDDQIPGFDESSGFSQQGPYQPLNALVGDYQAVRVMPSNQTVSLITLVLVVI
ncbi:hypothetical protein [Aeromonas veronii]|uniref:hypothetical protein n=1 Tax=Aeromonas veronii TaxID=654 RepID=UPI003AAFBC68